MIVVFVVEITQRKDATEYVSRIKHMMLVAFVMVPDLDPVIILSIVQNHTSVSVLVVSAHLI